MPFEVGGWGEAIFVRSLTTYIYIYIYITKMDIAHPPAITPFDSALSPVQTPPWRLFWLEQRLRSAWDHHFNVSKVWLHGYDMEIRHNRMILFFMDIIWYLSHDDMIWTICWIYIYIYIIYIYDIYIYDILDAIIILSKYQYV